MVGVEVREKELNRNLNKLVHCLVGFWNPSSVRGDDLKSWGTQLAKTWGLRGKLGLAKLERGKTLLEFDLLAKAEKALNLGRTSVGGFLLRLEKWRPKTGCLLEGEKRSEAWVRIVGLPRLILGSGHSEKGRGGVWGFLCSQFPNREAGGTAVGPDSGEAKL